MEKTFVESIHRSFLGSNIDLLLEITPVFYEKTRCTSMGDLLVFGAKNRMGKIFLERSVCTGRIHRSSKTNTIGFLCGDPKELYCLICENLFISSEMNKLFHE